MLDSVLDSIVMCVFVGYSDFGGFEGQHSNEKGWGRAHASMDGPWWVREKGWAEGGQRRKSKLAPGGAGFQHGATARVAVPSRVNILYITCSQLP